jgi:hypothetical protein
MEHLSVDVEGIVERSALLRRLGDLEEGRTGERVLRRLGSETACGRGGASRVPEVEVRTDVREPELRP